MPQQHTATPVDETPTLTANDHDSRDGGNERSLNEGGGEDETVTGANLENVGSK